MCQVHSMPGSFSAAKSTGIQTGIPLDRCRGRRLRRSSVCSAASPHPGRRLAACEAGFQPKKSAQKLMCSRQPGTTTENSRMLQRPLRPNFSASWLNFSRRSASALMAASAALASASAAFVAASPALRCSACFLKRSRSNSAAC